MKNGALKYKYFIESSIEIADRIEKYKPELSGKIVVLGNSGDDQFLNMEIADGFRVGKKNILILSTWGDKCALNSMAPVIFNQINEISLSYNILIDPHPKFYTEKTDTIDYLIDLSRSYPLYIKELNYDKSYIKSADIIISDHGSSIQKAALIGKPLIVLPGLDSELWSGGVTSEIMRLAPAYNFDISMLENINNLNRTAILPDLINSYPGEFEKNFMEWFTNKYL
jgi:hypothetical protein